MVKTRFAIVMINTHCYYLFIVIPIGINNDNQPFNSQSVLQVVKTTGRSMRVASHCLALLHGGGIDARYVMKIVSATGGKIKPADIRPDLAPLFNASNSAA